MLKRTFILSLSLSILPLAAHAQYSSILSHPKAPAQEVVVEEVQTIEAAPQGALRNTVESAASGSGFGAPDETDFKGDYAKAHSISLEEDGDVAVNGVVINPDVAPAPDAEDAEIDDISAASLSSNSDTFVELAGTYQDFLVRPGSTFDVVLMTEPGRSWNFDNSSLKNVEFIAQNSDNNLTIYSFKAVKDGFERMYFDYVDRSNGAPSVVESRILDLSIGVPSAKKE